VLQHPWPGTALQFGAPGTISCEVRRGCGGQRELTGLVLPHTIGAVKQGMLQGGDGGEGNGGKSGCPACCVRATDMARPTARAQAQGSPLPAGLAVVAAILGIEGLQTG